MPDRSLPRARDLGLVAAGGAVGTGLRYAIIEALPSGGAPLAILAINVAGALALGALLEVLGSRPGPVSSRLRLLLGTGVLGGFTTYSALALDTVSFAGAPLIAAAYAGGTLVAGLGAASAGIALVRRAR
ncbi:CrcB family protein [Naasia sp. SYSU D00057]|uniref:fluoride efflux transporter FluC n=1 Tax=Naasia sp. SYSU D00057 TaxID=2817380 RepID=UPI001B3012AF|nr:CrcB family protein [Naasia sp. SYSU D00057]